ncbi:hypothetical protein [Tichowtungia aerotolerans]|uniref:Uncharacterized protein n=1 Tax=Tichowtungia aerotolerans TaxID=2697043 RepID=A0A6P1MA11_9BACT|nr:hypothetical protein [Tichowtungia aerotolerans]QHI68416.1 hypothetical protein GT409_02740 [Tichowtungia aerotolerans]
MMPQHGGVPNFSLKIPGPIKVLLILELTIGTLLTLSFHLYADSGDLAAANRTKLSLIVTILLAFFIFLVGTGRWWHPHLWRHGNSQKQHRHRTRNNRHRTRNRR